MKIFKNYFLILPAISLFTTFIKSDNDTPVVFRKFPAEEQIQQVPIKKLGKISYDGMMLFRDSIFIMRNQRGNSSGQHFSLLGLEETSPSRFMIPVGSRSGSANGFISNGIAGNHLWVYDISKDKIVVANIDSITDPRYTAKEFSLPVFHYSIQLSEQMKVTGSGNYDSEYKIARGDLETGILGHSIIPFNNSPKQLSRPEKMAYEAFLFLKPSGNKCVLACRYTDQIEVVDLESEKSTVVKGPDLYEPNVIEVSSADGGMVSSSSDDTRFAFIEGKTTNRFIYLLYRGKAKDYIGNPNGRYIFVYDWNGQPVKKLILQDYIRDFAVSGKDEVLYTYNQNSNSIGKTVLKW